MLRMEPSDRVERMLVGGLSFWESDKSGRTSKSSVQKLATRDSHQPIFEPESDRSDQILFNTKALVKIERCWIRERSEELNSIVDIYHTIAESLSSSSYTQIPFAILKAGSPYASTSFRIFMRKCKHVVLREFRGLDEGNMTQYIHELYSLSEVEGLPQLQKLLLQPVITNTMWSLNKRLWPSERETWCQNLDAFETLPAYEGVGGHNIHLSLKSPHDKVYGHRVWHLLDDSVLLTPWAFCLANVSSLTLTGGVADNVTLFGLLTAMSATPDNLQSLTYLPEIKEAKKTTSKHSCPLFARFRSLVDVRLGCAFCPEALGASNSVATATKNKKRWRIDWPTAMPCLCWRERVEREKQITTTENPCTILATLLEDCRSAMYAVDGHYSKIFGACGTYTVKPWYLELNMRMERLYTSRKGLRGKLAFDIIFLPLSHPPQASVGLKGGDTKAWMVEDDVLGQWRNGEGWPGYLPPGGPQPYQIHDRLSWDIGK
ncbi:hypothetical protein MMC18_006504 [Xylographa bjoerkii]|nr:hypothetical protein [Xylographa bjoerkii]